MRSPSRSGRCFGAGVILLALPACSGHGNAGRDADATEAGMDAAGMDAAGMDAGDFVPGVCNVMGTGASTTQTVGPEGGTVTLEGATVVIPPGALSDYWPITITSSTECPPDDLDVLSPMYVFEPEGLTFDMPAEVTIQYPGDSHPAMLRWTAPEIGWESDGFVGEGNSVSGMVAHFSNGYAGWFDRLIGLERLHFDAHPMSIERGEQATLRIWVRHIEYGAETCVVDQGVGTIPLQTVFLSGEPMGEEGITTVSPRSTTTYTATCSGVFEASASETVHVEPPLATLTASRTSIMQGEHSMLTWRSAPGLTCTLRDPSGRDLPNGADVSPSQTTQYRLICQGTSPDGRTPSDKTWSVTVRVSCHVAGNRCAGDADCCRPSTCASTGRCCAQVQTPCDERTPCCGGRLCVEHSCCAGVRKPCERPGDCCPGSTCSPAGVCCVPGGWSCAVNRDCCSGLCDDGTCAASDAGSSPFCTPVGAACSAGDTCCARAKCDRVSSSAGPTCCLRAQASCAGTECCVTGEFEDYEVDCTDGRCCNPEGGDCEYDSDCCNPATCGPHHMCCSPEGGHCVYDRDCCSPATCSGGRCSQACPTGQVWCPNPPAHCATLGRDADCNGCGDACSAGRHCCGSPRGCRDTMNDPTACGPSCMACPSTVACTDGSCCDWGVTCMVESTLLPSVTCCAGLSCRAEDRVELSHGAGRCCAEVGRPCRDRDAFPFDCCGLMQCGVSGVCVCLSANMECTTAADCCGGLVCHSRSLPYTTPGCLVCTPSGPTSRCNGPEDCCSGSCVGPAPFHCG